MSYAVLHDEMDRPKSKIRDHERTKINRSFAERGFISPGQSLYELWPREVVPASVLRPMKLPKGASKEALAFRRQHRDLVTRQGWTDAKRVGMALRFIP